MKLFINLFCHSAFIFSRYMKRFLIIIPLILLFLGCNQGIAPTEIEEEIGFGGKITFSGTWADSIKRTHIVAFENPLLSSSDFNILNLKYVSEEIPFGTTEFNYKTTFNAVIQPVQPTKISYLVVVQSSAPELSLDRSAWYVVGVYTITGDQSQPATIYLENKTFINNINITCDFNNPPPQPPN